MRTVRVERRIEAPAEEVFELLTDHAGYASFRGVRGAELVREGSPDPNGLGAMRRVSVGPVRFDVWTSTFRVPARFGEGAFTALAAFAIRTGFTRMLAEADRRLARAA